MALDRGFLCGYLKGRQISACPFVVFNRFVVDNIKGMRAFDRQ